MTAKRILYLHESALSHAEYTQYVESFNELVEGDRSQDPSVSVREARGWLKGRYAANNTVDAVTIDKVYLLLFSFPPATSPSYRGAAEPPKLSQPAGLTDFSLCHPTLHTYTDHFVIISHFSFRFSASSILNSAPPIPSQQASSTQSSA